MCAYFRNIFQAIFMPKQLQDEIARGNRYRDQIDKLTTTFKNQPIILTMLYNVRIIGENGGGKAAGHRARKYLAANMEKIQTKV